MKDYRSYALIELLDMAKTQAYILDDSITEEEAEILVQQLDNEYVETILKAYGNEFETAKALIDLTRATITDDNLANRVAVHKLNRGDFAFRDELVNFLSIPEVRNHFTKGEVYYDARTAIAEIHDYANLVVETCYSLESLTDSFARELKMNPNNVDLELDYDSPEYLEARMGRESDFENSSFYA